MEKNETGLFITLLTILFIGLKLTHVIDWSWWWVLAPLWVPTVIGLILILAVAAITRNER